MSPRYSSYSRKPNYKSHMERQIADLFEKHKIPFIYEKPTAVVDYGKTKIWYPDFTLSYGIVVEYFGISGNKDYEYRTSHKLKVYKKNQIPVIALHSKGSTAPGEPVCLKISQRSSTNILMIWMGRYICHSQINSILCWLL